MMINKPSPNIRFNLWLFLNRRDISPDTIDNILSDDCPASVISRTLVTYLESRAAVTERNYVAELKATISRLDALDRQYREHFIPVLVARLFDQLGSAQAVTAWIRENRELFEGYEQEVKRAYLKISNS